MRFAKSPLVAKEDTASRGLLKAAHLPQARSPEALGKAPVASSPRSPMHDLSNGCLLVAGLPAQPRLQAAVWRYRGY